MYRFLLRSVHNARNCSGCVYEAFVLPGKCDKSAAPVLRFNKGCGIKALSTSPVSLCEAVPSNPSEKTNADKVTDPKETPALVSQKAEDDGKVSMVAEQREEPAPLKTEVGSTTDQQLEVKVKNTEEKPEQVKTDESKSGKENLLKLLGAMKVEVTNKRKLKNLKVKQDDKSNHKSKPADMQSTISMFQEATVATSSQSSMLNPQLVAAASAAASTLPNHTQAKSELLRQLRQHEAVTEAQKKGDMKDLGKIIADMKLGKHNSRQKPRLDNQIWSDEDGRGYTHERGITAELDGVRKRWNLFTGRKLNIFLPTTDQDGVEPAVARPTLWDMDFANRLSLSTNQMPRNGFDEMIQWTREGKMWQYPINNEAGLEEEANVPFHEHIFLHKHLEEGFASEGPVRHFMELVAAGLSRNPYLTVQQKKEHISWFRDYFHQKQDVLKDADVFLN
ncbi:28S ribosomal protein S31, mitochondrial [Anabas testudineus]|uniref:Small ribosomal subunit protein mS31 n=1 Tax=Anabas testudineus TaxID=64144 RepID=A0A3Q1IK43_ANATE|nr:28S ribosomal protein S31, mitochondrial [Anabas testudineus]